MIPRVRPEPSFAASSSNHGSSGQGPTAGNGTLAIWVLAGILAGLISYRLTPQIVATVQALPAVVFSR